MLLSETPEVLQSGARGNEHFLEWLQVDLLIAYGPHRIGRLRSPDLKPWDPKP